MQNLATSLKVKCVLVSECTDPSNRRVRTLVGQTLSCVTEIAAQTTTDAGRFESLGADAGGISVTGNMKFEQRIPQSLLERAEVLRRDWGIGRPVWIAASTHEGEDEMFYPILLSLYIFLF